MLKAKVNESQQVAWVLRLNDKHHILYEAGNREWRRKLLKKKVRSIC